MSRSGTIARRTFLIGSAAIAGGAAFGWYAYRKPHPNPLLNGDGIAALTPSRAALVGAAARRLDVAADTLRTEGGAVIAPDGTRLACGDDDSIDVIDIAALVLIDSILASPSPRGLCFFA